jgi:hypothetical protein
MRGRECSEISGSLLRLTQRFATWRKSRSAGQRIPEKLWRAAAKVAAEHGVNRTARALSLDYYYLKQRVGDASSKTTSQFIELPSPPMSAMNACVIELEDARGSRMRLELKGPSAPDVLELSRSFWSAD